MYCVTCASHSASGMPSPLTLAASGSGVAVGGSGEAPRVGVAAGVAGVQEASDIETISDVSATAEGQPASTRFPPWFLNRIQEAIGPIIPERAHGIPRARATVSLLPGIDEKCIMEG